MLYMKFEINILNNYKVFKFVNSVKLKLKVPQFGLNHLFIFFKKYIYIYI